MRFEPNVNFTDAMEKIARVGRSERSLFSLGLIEGGQYPDDRENAKYPISISSSVDYCLHPREYLSAVLGISFVMPNFTVRSLSIVPLTSH